MTRRQLLAVLASQAPAGLTLERTLELEGDSHHVQGLVVDGERLLVTSVDKPAHRGLLLEFSLSDGRRLRELEIQHGTCYHPGGFDASPEALFIPVAEYSARSRAVIQRRHPQTFELQHSFDVADHIGALTLWNGHLLGANWDARRLYEWDLQGRQLRVRDNPSSSRYQDFKLRDSLLVASGLRAPAGIVEWLDPESLEVRRALPFERTDRRVFFTNEGMDLRAGRLYLLPEDTRSRLFVFRLNA